MKPNQNTRLLGLFFLLGGAGTTYLNWHSVLTSGTYWPTASFLTTIAFFIGLALLFLRTPKREDSLHQNKLYQNNLH